MSLREIQENFQDYVLQHEQPAIRDSVVSTAKVNADVRLNVYKNAYSLRLIEILASYFPMLQQWVGEDVFNNMMLKYIEAYPSNHFSVRYFGRHFHQFIANDFLKPEQAEMAYFEWSLEGALDAIDGPHLIIDDMAKIPPESWAGLQLQPHPSACLIKLYYNVPEIWLALKDEKSPPAVAKQKDSAMWLLWRWQTQAYFCSLSEQQLWMFTALQQGQSFADICEGLSEMMPEDDVALFAGNNLSGWVNEGVFTAMTLL